jgi:hypothetical protein
MCTVSFIARKHGYVLAMNRDEKLSRAKGLPPKVISIGERKVICPSEPGGGTWIALNDSQVTFALINWYSISASVEIGAASRGAVVNAVRLAGSPDSVSGILAKLPLGKINPFRLIGIFPASRQVIQWQWDRKKLACKNHRWRAQQWISSGFDEPVAQRVRSKTFRRVLKQKSAGSLNWIRSLHRSHSPQAGPFSTCMHRRDAATVSYTEVSVSPQEAIMRHHAEALCKSRKFGSQRL